nr:hypothetical protein [Tanacetum cinerariifolium]
VHAEESTLDNNPTASEQVSTEHTVVKTFLNPLMVENLLKIVWLSTHHITLCVKSWLVLSERLQTGCCCYMILLSLMFLLFVPAGFFIFYWFLVAAVWLFAAVLVCSCCWNKDAILELTSEDLSRILKIVPAGRYVVPADRLRSHSCCWVSAGKHSFCCQ